MVPVFGVYCNERIQMKINNRKKAFGVKSRRDLAQASGCPIPVGVLTSSGSDVWQYTQSITNKESSLSLGVQRFYWGSITYAWMTEHVVDLTQALQRSREYHMAQGPQ